MPDLILENIFDDKRYEQLNKIAPMYSFKDARQIAVRRSRTWAICLGSRIKHKRVIQQYEHKAKEASETIKEKIDSQTVAILRVTAKEIRLYGGPGYAGPVLYQDLKLTPNKLVRDLVLDKNLKVVPLSIEVLPQLDADHIFITSDTGAEEKAKELLANPLGRIFPQSRRVMCIK